MGILYNKGTTWFAWNTKQPWSGKRYLLNLTTPDGPTTDEVEITAISSDDSSDYSILEEFQQGNLAQMNMPEMKNPDKQPNTEDG